MKTSGENKVSIFKNVYDKTGKYTISIDDALDRIGSGKSAKTIIELRNEKDEARQKKIKESSLPSVTFSGIFENRIDSELIEHSGFICLDFDDVDVEEYKKIFIDYQYTYAVWISPRGNGVKVLIRIADGKKHRKHFMSLKKEFPNTDHKCINESRVCFESYDPDIYINKESKVYTSFIEFEITENKTVTTDVFEIYKKLISWTEKDNKKSFYDGNRNQFIYVIAGALCRYGISQSDCESMLKKDYERPGFSKKEIDLTINSAYKKNNDKFASVEFSKNKLYSKETQHEVNPDIFKEGFNPDDVIYGSSCYESAYRIYTHGYESSETTFIPQLDRHFKFKRGEITLLTGIGNYGKSHYLNQLQLIRSIHAGNKWAVFSPENNPAHEYYFDMTEMLLGCSCEPSNKNRPSKEKFDAAYEFVSQHFFYVYPESLAPSPSYIKSRFLELVLKENIDGVMIDPFNQLENDYQKNGNRSDKYLEVLLPDFQRFAQQNNLFFLLIAHPHKLQKPKGEDNYPCPDVFEIADGAMWNNKCDNILVYHRPFGQSEPSNSLCEHHSKKIRRQKTNGEKGSFQFNLDRKKRRFYFNGFSPLDGNRFDCSDTAPQATQTSFERLSLEKEFTPPF